MEDADTYSLEIIQEEDRRKMIFSAVPYSHLYKSKGDYLNPGETGGQGGA